MKLITFSILSALIFIQASAQQCFSRSNKQQPNPSGQADLFGGQEDFSLVLLNAINKFMPKENLFFSPYSTHQALLLAYFMAGGQTEKNLKKVLRLNENQGKSDTYFAYKLNRSLTNFIDAPNEFTSANKIYISNEIAVKKCVKNDFPEELEPLRFKIDPEGSRLAINGWVKDKTHHKITNLLPPDSIDAKTSLVLVNAAHFKGIWANKFNPKFTRSEIFYVSPSKQIKVDMMYMEGTFRYDNSETLGCKILELPYQGENIGMFILLPTSPNSENSIDATLKNLNLQNFRKVVARGSLISTTVKVGLPKFSVETTVDLVPILKQMGIGDLFEANADLTTLIQDGKVTLGKALHKAKIVVNEQGTEAAAATVLVQGASSRLTQPQLFICDHPFIYFVYHKDKKAMLFGGVFRRPY